MSDLLNWLKMVADAYESVGDEDSARFGRQAADRIEQLEKRLADYDISAGRAHQYRAEAKVARRALSLDENSECVSPSDIRNCIEQLEREKENQKETIIRMEELYNPLKQERDELAESVDRFAATFGRLRSAINRVDSPSTGYCEESIHEVFNLIEQSPQTSLAEVMAKQAVRSYIRGYADATLQCEIGCDGASSEQELFQEALPHAKQHAQQIRNGKDGE